MIERNVYLTDNQFFKNKTGPTWLKEWNELTGKEPASEGSKARQIFAAVPETPTAYADIWRAAGFDCDPYLRTELRRLEKGQFLSCLIEENGTEYWCRSQRAE